jgi:hypothetical protein
MIMRMSMITMVVMAVGMLMRMSMTRMIVMGVRMIVVMGRIIAVRVVVCRRSMTARLEPETLRSRRKQSQCRWFWNSGRDAPSTGIKIRPSSHGAGVLELVSVDHGQPSVNMPKGVTHSFRVCSIMSNSIRVAMILLYNVSEFLSPATTTTANRVLVLAHLLLVHGYTVRVTVSMPMTIAVMMAMVMMPSRGPHAEQVDEQAYNRYREELMCVHLGRVHNSLYRLEHDEDGDEDEEAAYEDRSSSGFAQDLLEGRHEIRWRLTVRKPRKSLHSREAKRVLPIWLPRRSHRGPQPDSDAQTVEQHMNG